MRSVMVCGEMGREGGGETKKRGDDRVPVIRVVLFCPQLRHQIASSCACASRRSLFIRMKWNEARTAAQSRER